MPLSFVRQDITRMHVDAIVNAANNSLLGGGGVDGAIHRAAGPELLRECRGLNGCRTGEAKITRGYRLPAKYVIHTVGPIWRGGSKGEAELLANCYRSSLALAAKHDLHSIAFPMISTGVYGYPKGEAMQIAVREITDFLGDHDMDVYVVVFDRQAYAISEKLFSNIQAFIDDEYIGPEYEEQERRRRILGNFPPEHFPDSLDTYSDSAFVGLSEVLPAPAMRIDDSLEDVLAKVDESFSAMLMRKIDEKGMKDADCYKRANVDRKLFSKIRSDPAYRPSKPTAIAFAIALELPLAEAAELLMKAGFALSHSSKFDVIIEYFITRGNYNIYEINETLFAFDQSLLGA